MFFFILSVHMSMIRASTEQNMINYIYISFNFTSQVNLTKLQNKNNQYICIPNSETLEVCGSYFLSKHRDTEVLLSYIYCMFSCLGFVVMLVVAMYTYNIL